MLILHYNGSNSFLFANVTKIHQFKAKDSEKMPCPLSVGNTSKLFTLNNMKKTESKGSVKHFSADYNPVDSSNILDIQKYLMKET